MRPLRRIPLGHEADLRLDLLVNLTGHYAWEVRQSLPPPTPRHRKGQEVQRGLGMYGQDRTVAEEDGRVISDYVRFATVDDEARCAAKRELTDHCKALLRDGRAGL